MSDLITRISADIDKDPYYEDCFANGGDIDDGVKVNYLIFKGAVVNIPGLDKGGED